VTPVASSFRTARSAPSPRSSVDFLLQALRRHGGKHHQSSRRRSGCTGRNFQAEDERARHQQRRCRSRTPVTFLGENTHADSSHYLQSRPWLARPLDQQTRAAQSRGRVRVCDSGAHRAVTPRSAPLPPASSICAASSRKELEQTSKELARVRRAQLTIAVDGDDDAVALALIGHRDTLDAESERLHRRSC